MENCLFCKIVNNEIDSQKVYEDEKLIAINDINPQAPIHILIIPRKHCATIMDLEETDDNLVGSIFITAKKIAREKELDESGFRIVVNCGSGAGQTIFHIHFHLLGGRPMGWPPG